MRFTDIFVRRPILAGVVNVLILLIGLSSLNSLTVRQYPELTNTVVTITTIYPGATAELMQGFVTTPIQQSVASADGVEYLTSASKQGTSTITAYIRLNFPPDVAMTEIMAKVQEVNSILPKEIQSPVISKSTGETYDILYVGFSCPDMTDEQITDYIKRQIQPRVSTISGVAGIDLIGAQTFAMRLWIDPNKMSARDVSATDIYNALLKNNYQSAPGQTKGHFVTYHVQANTDLESVEQFKDMIIKSDGLSVVRMGDIAYIELSSENYDSIVKMNGQQSVFIGIKNTPTSNPLTVVSNVLKMLEEYKPNLPPHFTYTVAYDSTEFIVESIGEVIQTLGEAILIVIVVIFLFLGSFRAVTIPVVTIPLSIIGVATVLLTLGFSINLLTLLAMVLAIGLVVDDAIVVVENVYRHIATGKTPFEAAIIGSREIAVPVITMTITLVAVYTPIAFMGGVTGTLFREFALTLAGSVVISGIVALTLSPMMCSKILTKEALSGSFALKIEHLFHELSMKYQRILKNVIQKRHVVIFVFVLILGTSWFFTLFIPSELAPHEDQGIVMVSTKAPQYANIDYTSYYTDRLYDILKENHERHMIFTFAGLTTYNDGFGGLILKPWSKRKRSSHQILAEMQGKFGGITGIQAFAFEPAPLPGSAGGLPIQFVINSMADHRVIFQVMEKLKADAMKSGHFMVVDSDLNFNNPTLKIDINHSKATQMNASMQDIGSTLALMMGENYVNFFNLYGRSYKVIPMSERGFRLTPESVGDFYINMSNGRQFPLNTIADLRIETQANQLYQFNQINSATFQAMLMPHAKMGDAISYLISYGKQNLPAGFTYDFLSESRQYVQEGNALYAIFIFAVVIIFLVLAAQFESLRDPFVIMLSVPMSIFGALFILFLGTASLNIYSEIGLITLVGLITKHGILIVEFANQLQLDHGRTREQAIVESATIRLRPILMTTAAMVVGLVPLLMATGAGAASRFSIGIVIVAGMLIGTTFTIFVVPSFYMLISRPKTALPDISHIE
ncbi:efflux RND transporter permease subunit [Candidatus Paracaedibacter symbiosus]|uniref:efflux RND transporter permease subunit n=1 Tax=Candidatus Paracaedibacter symbiosus TaxID=244582 RepID=UPI000509857D|nr:efflux RND transporter permease subunit [Candidatus Paracaedibacter symbiosus]